MKPSLFSKSMSSAFAGVVLAVGAGLATNAMAADATASLGVSASVAANCEISSTPVAFGAYDPVTANASASLDQTGTVTVVCTNGADVSIKLGQGANPDAGSDEITPLRRMSDDNGASPSFLSYSLYSDAQQTLVWGNDETTGVARTGTGVADQLTVYGRIAAGQNVPAGNYSDTVTATVTF